MSKMKSVPVGRVRLGVRDDNDQYRELRPFAGNLALYSWASIVLRRAGIADSDNYRLNGLYIEYENVADPEDAVSVPDPGRGDGIDYYTGLALPKDYIRVSPRFVSIESTDEAKYPAGNRLYIQGQTGGSIGVNGSTFAYANNSKICGTALVAIRNVGDRTQDLVAARFYYPAEQQIVKPQSGQIDVTWELTIDLDAGDEES